LHLAKEEIETQLQFATLSPLQITNPKAK